jgi:hypothetical protein
LFTYVALGVRFRLAPDTATEHGVCGVPSKVTDAGHVTSVVDAAFSIAKSLLSLLAS